MTASRFLIAGSVAALLHIGVAVAQTPTPSPTTPPTHPAVPGEQQPTPSPSTPPTHPAVEGREQGATFETLDKDGDGRISKTEAQADMKVAQQFSRYDKNGNGFIEKDEVMSSNAPPETPKE
jgi:hypothetical protein